MKITIEQGELRIGERLWLSPPQFDREDHRWRRVWGWHGGDEYGNCSVYFQLPLIGGLTFFYELDFQRDVLLPDPGQNAWIDRRYYPDEWDGGGNGASKDEPSGA